MSTASWTRIIQPRDFVHVWTCFDFTITSSYFSLESACFDDDQGISWKLCLKLEDRDQFIGLQYMNGVDGETVRLKHLVHLLDKHGKIFQPERFPQGTNTFIANRPARWVKLPFDLRRELESLLHNGNLRIQLRLVKNPVKQTGLGPEVSDNDISGWISDFSTFFQDPTLFDITISSGVETFTAHKVVLAARSTVFRAMLEAPMKEAASSCIKVDEFSPEVVKGMLKFLYTDDVTMVTPALASEFLQIADYYNLAKLKFQAESTLGKNLTIENAVEVVKYAIMFGLARLKSLAIQFIVQNDVPLADNPGLEGIARTNLKDFLELLKATGGK